MSPERLRPGHRLLARQAYDVHMDGTRTSAWYVTRLALVVAIALILLATMSLFGSPFAGGWLYVDVPARWRPVLALLPFVAYLAMWVGLAWMIRIVRGSGNEPPSWRYRDR